TRYASHPVTRAQALSFYPGARPVEVVPAPGVTAVALFASSKQSYLVRDRARYRDETATAPRRPYSLAVAAEGTLPGGSADRRFAWRASRTGHGAVRGGRPDDEACARRGERDRDRDRRRLVALRQAGDLGSSGIDAAGAAGIRRPPRKGAAIAARLRPVAHAV